MIERLSAVLSDGYRVEREIGSGGMASVYLAEDLRHGRRVAIKVLKPELAAAIGVERFVREIRIAAQLSHPHILPLLDSGEADGLLYYVMPYVHGVSLRERLDREKQLPVADALRFAAEVADALDHAHAHGILHRDIKPENILITGSHALVADFGIAGALGRAGGDRLTGTGIVVGTPGYLSPEQATGEAELDARSDVYALGCVLYEMLAGQPPYAGPTMQAMLASQLSGPVPSVRTARETVTEPTDRAIARAMAKVPADRFASAGEFAAALTASVAAGSPAGRRRRPAVAAAVVLGAAALLAFALDTGGIRERFGSVAPGSIAAGSDGRPAIAVLPFADMSPDGDQAYFSDGISEEILTVLSRIQRLKVAARTSAFAYRGGVADLRRAGEQLGVPYLLAGSVRKDGDRLRIAAELVSAADGLRLWSETYDRRLADVFAVQTEIAEAIAAALQIPLGLQGDELAPPTVHADAHELYLTARAAMRGRGRGVERAIGLFKQAVTWDSAWAPAWAGLAEAHAMYPLYAEQHGESYDSTLWATSLGEAATAARRALALDPRNASARVALGGVYRDRWEWAAAEAEFLRALEFDPDNAEAHLQYAELLWGTGRLDESLRETGRALGLDQAPVMYDVHGFVMYMNRRFTEAEALLEEGINRDPGGEVHFLRTVLASLMLFDGRYRTALDRFAVYFTDSVTYRRMGEALETRDASRLEGVETARGLAQTWMLLGEPERALDVLEAMALRLPFRVQYEIWDPYLEPLRDLPRFRTVLLPRLNLERVRPRFAPPT